MSSTAKREVKRQRSVGLRSRFVLPSVSLLLSAAVAAQEPLDFVLAVDTSGSMAFEVMQVQTNLNAFASTLFLDGYDLHLILISNNDICAPVPLGSGSCPVDENLPGYRHVVQTIGSSDALQKILDTYAMWSGSLRPGSRRSVMVVSDDDSALGAADFVDGLIALDPDFSSFQFHAIAASGQGTLVLSDPGPCDCLFGDSGCVPKSADEGAVYKELTAVRPGVFYDLCTQDFAPAWPLIVNSIDGLIFFDGFRSGDTSLWSGATP